MNETLRHRGPDDVGYFQDGPIGLAHRRLAIIDLETGRQPIANEDGSVVVVFNGEIYNYRDLRETLTRHGHTFSTETDTEVVVHGYEEYGLDVLDRLSGMFALALWDADSERLLLARDPMGIKPLYVAYEDGTGAGSQCLAFGSELPAVLAAEVDHGDLDKDALARYFAFGFVPAPKTAFANVRAMLPGERVLVTDDGIERRSYYTPTVPTRAPGIGVAASELRDLVETAVKRRLMADVPLGAFLSGGIDSSAIVGTMATVTDQPVKTFTVGFEDAMFDESWAAREVAEYHDTEHHEMTVTAEEVRELIPDVLARLGQPFADQSLLPTYVVARETGEHVKVALSGDGADELFAGYDKYLGEYYSRYYRAVPGPVRRKVVEPLVGALPASRGRRTGEFTRKLQKFVRGGDADLVRRHSEWLKVAGRPTDRAFPRLDVEGEAESDVARAHGEVAELFEGGRDDLAEMQAVDTRHVLPNQMLHKVDLASMYNSLEVRVPFLDIDVVEYAHSLPTAYKMTRSGRKRVLKRAFHDVLPNATLNRSKQGFDMPIGEWLKGPLAGEFIDRISGLETDLVDTNAVMDIYDEHGHRDEHGKFLWAVYVFAVWTDRMHDQGVLDSW